MTKVVCVTDTPIKAQWITIIDEPSFKRQPAQVRLQALQLHEDAALLLMKAAKALIESQGLNVLQELHNDKPSEYTIVEWQSLSALQASLKCAEAGSFRVCCLKFGSYDQQDRAEPLSYVTLPSPQLREDHIMIAFRVACSRPVRACVHAVFLVPRNTYVVKPTATVQCSREAMQADMGFVRYQKGQCSTCGREALHLSACMQCGAHAYCSSMCRQNDERVHWLLCQKIRRFKDARNL